MNPGICEATKYRSGASSRKYVDKDGNILSHLRPDWIWEGCDVTIKWFQVWFLHMMNFLTVCFLATFKYLWWDKRRHEGHEGGSGALGDEMMSGTEGRRVERWQVACCGRCSVGGGRSGVLLSVITDDILVVFRRTSFTIQQVVPYSSITHRCGSSRRSDGGSEIWSAERLEKWCWRVACSIIDWRTGPETKLLYLMHWMWERAGQNQSESSWWTQRSS